MAMENRSGKEAYSAGWILMENFLLGVMFLSGAFVMRFAAVDGVPLLSIAYLGFVAIMLGFVLRRQLCTRCCYYGKRCHCGWGVYSAKLFRRRETGAKVSGMPAMVTWGVAMGLPLTAALAGIPGGAVTLSALIPELPVFAVTAAVNGFLHKKDCSDCLMRCNCPGSAAPCGD